MFILLEKLFIATRDSFSSLMEKTGVYEILRYMTRQKVMILMYHGVTGKESTPLQMFDPRHISLNRFIWQIEYLKKHYSFITFQEFTDWKEGKIKKLPSNPVLLTFDDGYKNNYTQLFPLLKQYHIPAMIYLPTKMINKKGIADYNLIHYCLAKTEQKKMTISIKEYFLETSKQKISALHMLKEEARKQVDAQEFFNTIKKETKVACKEINDEDFAFMTWEECKEMKQNGIEFGAHTHSHPVLTKIDKKTCEEELKQAKEIIEKKLSPCEHFSYPYGSYNDTVMQIAKKYYKTAVIIKHGYNTKRTNLYTLKRIPITNKNTKWSFVLDIFCNFSLFHHWLIIVYSYLRKYMLK